MGGITVVPIEDTMAGVIMEAITGVIIRTWAITHHFIGGLQ